jgi:hypothetical protein
MTVDGRMDFTTGKGFQMAHKTRPIVSMDDVPAGYEQISKIAAAHGDPTRSLHSYLSDAHRTGALPAVKLFRTAGDGRTGPVFVDRAAADRLLADYRAARAAETPVVDDEQPTAEAVAPTPTPVVDAMESLQRAIAALSVDVRNLQAAMELRTEAEAWKANA